MQHSIHSPQKEAVDVKYWSNPSNRHKSMYLKNVHIFLFLFTLMEDPSFLYFDMTFSFYIHNENLLFILIPLTKICPIPINHLSFLFNDQIIYRNRMKVDYHILYDFFHIAPFCYLIVSGYSVGTIFTSGVSISG